MVSRFGVVGWLVRSFVVLSFVRSLVSSLVRSFIRLAEVDGLSACLLACFLPSLLACLLA